MRFNVKALGLGFGIFWGGAMLLVGIANLIWHDYGMACLELAAPIYPGYDPTDSVAQVFVGTLYGLVDRSVGGIIFAWLYNLFIPTRSPA